MHRRDFITKVGAGVIGATFLPGCIQTVQILPVDPDFVPKAAPGEKNESGPLRFGLMTDLHYADRSTAGLRYYRDSLSKAVASIGLFNEQKVDFVIETGDFKDQAQSPSEATSISYLQAIEAVIQQFNGPTYHVLGNHDMDSISKPQFMANIENTSIDPTHCYYSFDVKGVHCIVLDANYNNDGSDYDHGNFDWTSPNIPQVQLNWLRQDLAAAQGPATVFLHQLLEGQGSLYVDNAVAVRTILEDSGKVLAVFQGHHHAGSYNLINGIHYYTLKAMVEGPFPQNNAYAVVEVLPDRIIITGYVNVDDVELAKLNVSGRQC